MSGTSPGLLPPPRHLLVIDDDELDVEMVMRCLQDLDADYRVTHVPDGQAALEALQDEQSAFVGKHLALIVDLNMPRMDGISLLRRLRTNKTFSGGPVFVFFGSDRAADINLAKSFDIAGYVTKPQGLSAMRQSISTLVDFLGLIHTGPYKPLSLR